MKGLLIYDLIGAKRNNWFIDSLINNFKQHNIQLDLVIMQDDNFSLCEKVDFAIVRTIAPQINKYLENEGIRVFNNFNTSFIANDKWQTYLFCNKLGIPTMQTSQDVNTFNNNFPCIMKSCDGHGGSEVFWIDCLDTLNALVQKFNALNKKFILQTPCSDLGKDMRIYVLGKEIIASALRFNPQSFKSNYSLGGQVQSVTPTDYQIEIVNKITSYLKSDYIGIDFVLHNGNWVLNEIEDIVGSRMLYNITKIDVAKTYCDYICKVLN